MHWPSRVWNIGDVDENGRQLYWSHDPTKEDRERRAEFERDFDARQLRRTIESAG